MKTLIKLSAISFFSFGLSACSLLSPENLLDDNTSYSELCYQAHNGVFGYEKRAKKVLKEMGRDWNSAECNRLAIEEEKLQRIKETKRY